MIVQTDEQKEAEIERRAQERVARAVESLPVVIAKEVRDAIDSVADKNAEAMERVLRGMVADKELMGTVADSFQTHYLRLWREWLGTRVWNFMLYGAMGLLLGWLTLKQLFGVGSEK